MIKKVAKLFLACMMICSGLLSNIRMAYAAEDGTTYEIYPIPQKMSYENGEYVITTQANVVYDSEIDQDTKNRLLEVMKLKNITVKEGTKYEEGILNVFVGVQNSKGPASAYINEKYKIDESLFTHSDSYYLSSKDNVISVLGKDSDASFYGLTSLYHVFTQMDSLTIRNFTIEDYADVVSRGFIEGYYGNPWSTQDRVNLMHWSGYYKLNSYFYAPKDDPKHNGKWRELYTAEEIQEKIKPLADAGNQSKTRFVYALHPFMHSPIAKPDQNLDGYEEDLNILKKKFDQVIQAGVRQIAILADDAAFWGSQNYIRLLNDMTDWLKEKQKEYSDLKITLPFCTQEYMYNGEDYYKKFPSNVQIVMTGGKVWGEVSQGFTNKFKEKVGRGPYMWINWPCTDNSKKHLIMGGYDNFLHPNVSPENIEGIVLNPMQQSEPSKVAIFGNAAYSWNIWENKEEAAKVWNASFANVDHKSSVSTPASEALKELSKHMINQAMDGRVVALDESLELKKILTPLKEKLASGNYSIEELEKVEKEFLKLQEAAKIYREEGNKDLLGDFKDYTTKEANEQMAPWIDCWDDTTKAAIAYLKALKSYKNGDVSSMLSYYTEGQSAFTASKSHGFYYVDHLEYAEVGVQHIVPFIKTMDSYLATKVLEETDPNIITKTYISDVFTNPSSGDIKNVFDENDSTNVQFTNPNYLYKDNYVGVKFNRPMDVTSIRFAFGGGKNHFYHSKLEYTTDGTTWKAVKDNTVYERLYNDETPIEEKDLNLENVLGIRLIATQDNGVDLWLELKSIDINKKATTQVESYEIKEVTLENAEVAGGDLNYIKDNNKTSEVHIRYGGQNDKKDAIIENTAIVVDLGENKVIGSIYLAQGLTARDDIPNQAVVEYSTDKKTWHTFGNVKKENEQTITGYANARYLRIRNLEYKKVWWRIGEITVNAENHGPLSVTASGVDTIIGKHGSINDGSKNNKFEFLVDGKEDTCAWMASAKPDNQNINTNQGIQLTLNKNIEIKSLHLLQDSGDKVDNLKIQFLQNDGTWKDITTVQNASTKVDVQFENKGKTSAIRILNNGGNTNKWWKVYEVSLQTIANANKDNVFESKDSQILSVIEEDKVSLTSGDIVLNNNEYIGIDLKSIQKIKNLSADYSILTRSRGLQLQVSNNGVVWNPVENNSENLVGRYVRLMNLGPTTKVSLKKFDVLTNKIGKLGTLISSDIQENSSWGDSRNNGAGFDGNIDTITKFGGEPRKGNTIVYDLGQPVDVRSLRIYTIDTQLDYIRDASIQLSKDGKDFKDAFVIGDGVTDTDRDTAFGSISDENRKTDSNYPNKFYYGNDAIEDEVGKGARYIRILINANYPTRALAINEIMINKGGYISVEDDAAFTGTMEQKDHQPSNIFDRDLTTTYKPAEANGSLTYSFSDIDKIKGIRLVQKGIAKDVKVSGNVWNKNTHQVETVEFGTLAQAVNEFYLPENRSLLDVVITWKDELVEISELITVQNVEKADTEKTKLQKKLAEKPAAYDTWIRSSKEKYDALEEVAKTILKDAYVSKTSVESMIQSLDSAIQNAEVKAEEQKIQAIETIVNEHLDNKNHIYTSISFAQYERQINSMKKLLEDKENISVAQADSALKQIEEVKKGLEYSKYNREIAQTMLKGFGVFDETNYTKTSYQELKQAKDVLETLINKDLADNNVHPEEFLKATTLYTEKQEALVNIVKLKELLSQIEKYEKTLYTDASWNAYEAAVNNAKTLLDAGSKEAVTEAETAITSLEKALVYKSTVAIQDILAELNKWNREDYTQESYKVLSDAIAKAEADLNKNDDATNKANMKNLENAKKQLISVVALKEMNAQANAIKREDFTKDSIVALDKLVEESKSLFVNGTKEAIEKATSAIRNMLENELVVNAAGLANYQNNLILKNPMDYQESAYTIYKQAYDAIMALEVGNTSVEVFENAKEMLEKAIIDLEKTILYADYSKINDLKTTIPTNLNAYTKESVNALNQALSHIQYNLPRSQQSKVDAYEKALSKAISGLTLKKEPGNGNHSGNDNQGSGAIHGGQMDNGNGQSIDTNANNMGNGSTSSSNTGTQETKVPFALLSILSLSGLLLLMKKRNEN